MNPANDSFRGAKLPVEPTTRSMSLTYFGNLQGADAGRDTFTARVGQSYISVEIEAKLE
tara:strand:- start:217 stop:393 length:177 start_codon:yes stop_codon:yes gene_type:complete